MKFLIAVKSETNLVDYPINQIIIIFEMEDESLRHTIYEAVIIFTRKVRVPLRFKHENWSVPRIYTRSTRMKIARVDEILLVF